MNKAAVQNKIRKNHHKFVKITSRIEATRDEVRQTLLSTQAALFAVHNPCGIFASPIIEKSLLKISASHSIHLEMSYKPKSILHVFTRAFSTGGHTRVCERWIEVCAGDQVHSVVITNQGSTPIPESLKKVVSKSGGEIFFIKEDSPINMALELRYLASNYQYIVLHIHMYDVIPVLSFGTKDFKRPVLFFNHADHTFWLGGSVIDLLINFRMMSVNNNKNWRGISRNTLLPLPSGEIKSRSRALSTVTQKRSELGLSKNEKIILTIGSSYKFEPFAGLNFIETLEKILVRNKSAVFLIIGPSSDEKKWADIIKKFPNRVKVQGTIPYSQIDSYLQIADIALEPFPLGSPTALIDAVQYQIPCVSLSTPVNNYDAFIESGILCETQEELVERISTFIKNPPVECKLIDVLQKESSPDAIKKTITNFLSDLTQIHQIYAIEINENRNVSEFELFVAEQNFINALKLNSIMRSFLRRIIFSVVCYFPVRILMYLYPFCRRHFLM